jgi:hypothetical protein
MAVLIAGHQRSGTTLLKDLCNSQQYARFILGRWWKKRNAAILASHPLKGVNMARNLLFIFRYLVAVRSQDPTLVRNDHVENAMLRRFPGHSRVGDKYPDYIFWLNKLSRLENMKCVFIYRDPRDVASSTLKRARIELRGSWPDEMRDPGEIAQRWNQTIEMMERTLDRILAIRYEDLVTQPESVLQELGSWLEVDPEGFNQKMIRSTSIGKYQTGLSETEVEQVVSIAGPVMRRLGYL